MRVVIGVMGGARAGDAVMGHARDLGRMIAEQGWVLLNGGRNAGVMAASAEGAHSAGGLVIGVLPDDDTDGASADLDIAIQTGMGDARNVINVLSSRVVVALPGGPGTISEVAHALKAGRPVVAVNFPLGTTFFRYYETGRIVDVSMPREAIAAIQTFLDLEAEL